MQYTENYGLKLPGYGDNADVGDLNDNTTAIDALIHANRQIEAPAFSTDTAYTTGDMCVYENVLYKFTSDKAAGNWDSTKVTATNLADEVTEAAQSGGTTVVANPSAPATEDLNKLQVENAVYGIPDPTVTKEVESATGTQYVEFTDGADAPIVKCVTQITGYQSGSGTPSPDNIRPITAYNQSTISVGVDTEYAESDFNTSSGVTKTVESDGIIFSANGSGTYQTAGIGSVSNLILEAGSYELELDVISVTNPDSPCQIGLRKSNYTMAEPTINLQTSGHKIGIVTVEESVYISLLLNGGTSGVSNTIKIANFKCFKIEQQSTATFSNSIYQGNADFVGGEEAEAEKIKITISSGIQLYGTFGTDDALLFYYDLSIAVATYSRVTHPADNKLISNFYNSITVENENDMMDFEIRTNNNAQMISNRIYIRDSRFETALAFNQYIANNPIEVVVKLATPTTETITPTNLPIKSLFGYNHIESSTGDMELEYITQTYQPLVDLIQGSQHVYSTTEQVVGKWVDGSDVYEKTIVTEFNNAAPQYTLDLSAIGGDTTMPIYVSHSVLEAMEGSTPIKQITMPAATNSTYSSVSVQHQSSVVTGKSYIKVRYIKLTSNNRSLSKGASEESVDKVDKVDKVDEPTETIEEKEENER